MKKIAGGFFKVLLSLFAVVLCAAIVGGTIFGIQGYAMYQDAVKETSVDEKVGSIHNMEGYTKYEELPQMYVDAVISAEDHRFWSHGGVDIIAIGRAVWNDVKTLSFAEGGSTITQQLAKNLFFTQDKKLERKFAELFAAFDLESKYGKKEILELYVNTIYFGSGYYGIHDAAEGYFGKSPSQLDDYECVMLAGLPNAPSAYSPDANPKLAEQRMVQVLSRMVECNVITQTEADSLLT